MDTQTKQSNMATMGIILIALVVIGSLAVVAYQSQKSKQSTNTTMTEQVRPTTTTVEPTTGGSPAAMAKSGEYKDGTYTAVGDYVSPGGAEQVGVTITLKGGVVDSVNFESKAERPMSKQFQAKFASGYKELVLGKNINEVKLTKVSGSSLTPKGFNDAVEKIKVEAKNS